MDERQAIKALLRPWAPRTIESEARIEPGKIMIEF
jgi:hypothetical protein